jgi:arylsulfatase A-like enzyme
MTHSGTSQNGPSRRCCALLALACGLAACSGPPTPDVRQASGPAPVSKKPNILFILADDLGYGEVGYTGAGAGKIQTPNIDKLAKEGLRFSQAYAGAPVCAPSRCALITGLHTGHAFIRGNAKISLRPSDTTVPETLKAQGYATMTAGKWGLGVADSTGTPNKKGFDYFYGFLDQTHAHNSWPTFLYRNNEVVKLRNVVPNEGQYGQGVATVKLDFANDLFNDEILRFMDRTPAEKPFFIYAAFTAPHANNESKLCDVPDLGPYADKDWPQPEKLKAALITRLDRYVGDIMQKLHEKHLDENTLVIFTSDNGPHEEGSNHAVFDDAAGPLRGIKRDVYDGGFREPFIARWPGHVQPGDTRQVIAFWDFLPTAAELAGAAPPKTTDGLSFVPTLLGRPEQQKQHDFLYWEFHERGFEQAVLMRDGNWKGVRHSLTQPLELYNLNTDIGEKTNVAAAHPDIVAKITQFLATARTDSEEFPVRDTGRNVPAATRTAPVTTPNVPATPRN